MARVGVESVVEESLKRCAGKWAQTPKRGVPCRTSMKTVAVTGSGSQSTLMDLTAPAEANRASQECKQQSAESAPDDHRHQAEHNER